jgi:hypothetical protein
LDKPKTNPSSKGIKITMSIVFIFIGFIFCKYK